MTLTEFFIRENEIIFQETGITLVPTDKIIDIDPKEIGQLHTYTDSGCSPYCSIFNVVYDDGFEDCSQCPLEKAKNGCGNKDSTYQQVYHKLKMQGRRIHELSAIQDLVDVWNRQLKTSNHRQLKQQG